MSTSMDKAQRRYDNQVPEDFVEEWVANEGAEMIEEAYCEDPQGVDRVRWQEIMWDTIVEWSRK